MLSTKGCDRSSDGGAMGIDQNSDGAVIVLEGHRRLGSTLEDKRGFVLWSVYFMGVVMMMPWNMLINVNYFWDYKVSTTVNALLDQTLTPLSRKLNLLSFNGTNLVS